MGINKKSLKNRKIIFHIGYHKTASTWFQKVYFSNNPYIEFIDHQKCHELFVKKRSFDFSPSETINQLQNIISKQNKTVVFSDEEFSGNIHSGGNGGYAAKELADRIYNTFYHNNIKIIIFIRNQTSIIESCYRQYVKAGGAVVNVK